MNTTLPKPPAILLQQIENMLNKVGGPFPPFLNECVMDQVTRAWQAGYLTALLPGEGYNFGVPDPGNTNFRPDKGPLKKEETMFSESQETVKMESLRCAECGDVFHRIGKIISSRPQIGGAMLAEVEFASYPRGWRRLGETQVYCPKHTVEIRRQLWIDGKLAPFAQFPEAYMAPTVSPAFPAEKEE